MADTNAVKNNRKEIANGFSLPELGIGTAHIGGHIDPDYSKDDDSILFFKKALLEGYTHIDTSEFYGNGHTEELIGTAIKGFERKELIISTKVYKNHLKKQDLLNSARQSLSRLGISYIDLYSIHAPNADVPLEESFEALDELVAGGLVKNIGVSNFSPALLEKAQSLTQNKIVTNQIEYNLVTREKSHFHELTNMESEIVPYCQENDILLVAAVPLARGAVLEQNALMDMLSKKYKKTYAQIALNWLISQKNIVTIVKAGSESHMKENLGAVGWYMEADDVETLKTSYPFLR
jgi:diketogulonate reductase-like aldo/keto reductase